MKTEPGIEALLLAARNRAITELEGQPATQQNLDRMAWVAHATVRAQAELGLWAEWCVSSARDLDGLDVSVELEKTLVPGQSPIRIRWNFSRTVLQFLEVH